MGQVKHRRRALVLFLLGSVRVIVLDHELDLTRKNKPVNSLKMVNQRPMYVDSRKRRQKTVKGGEVGVARLQTSIRKRSTRVRELTCMTAFVQSDGSQLGGAVRKQALDRLPITGAKPARKEGEFDEGGEV